MTDPILVEVTRGDVVESRHRGAVAVFDADGSPVLEIGDTAQPVFPRSAVKAIQALPFVESGAADAYGFGDRELALACASHSGEPEHVERGVLDAVLKAELIPVLAPVAYGADGQTYNVNADTFAGAIAGALRAKRLLLLTDVPGVLDKDKKLIPELTVEDCRRLIADGTITGGMIPKIETCMYALDRGVEAVVILDGKVNHAVLLELFTNYGAGTLIRRG